MYHPGRVTDCVHDLWALLDNHGLSRIMPLPLRMMPVSLRCHHGRCRHRPEPTTDRPGSWLRPGLSRTVPDFLNSLKFQKRPPGLSWTFQDHPGPFQDHPGPPWTITAALRTCDGSSNRSDPGQSVAVCDRSFNCRDWGWFIWAVYTCICLLLCLGYCQCDNHEYPFQCNLFQWKHEFQGNNGIAACVQVFIKYNYRYKLQTWCSFYNAPR